MAALYRKNIINDKIFVSIQMQVLNALDLSPYFGLVKASVIADKCLHGEKKVDSEM